MVFEFGSGWLDAWRGVGIFKKFGAFVLCIAIYA